MSADDWDKVVFWVCVVGVAFFIMFDFNLGE